MCDANKLSVHFYCVFISLHKSPGAKSHHGVLDMSSFMILLPSFHTPV